MALDPTTLRDALREFMDPDYAGYTGYPADALGVGNAWGGAVTSYMSGIVSPPGITPAMLAAGESAFVASYQPTYVSPALTMLSTALAFYALAVVSPLGVTLPPPVLLVIAPLPNTLDGNAAATSLAAAIDTWVRTGTYTAPAGAPVPWA